MLSLKVWGIGKCYFFAQAREDQRRHAVGRNGLGTGIDLGKIRLELFRPRARVNGGDGAEQIDFPLRSGGGRLAKQGRQLVERDGENGGPDVGAVLPARENFGGDVRR